MGEEQGSWLHLVTKGINHWLVSHGQPHLAEDFLPFSWLVILFLSLVAFLSTRRMQLFPNGLQNLVEMIVEGFQSFAVSIIGKRGRDYAPFIGSLFIYILCLNMLGLIPGFVSPTANLNTTVALALVVFVMVQYSGLRANGPWGYIRHLMGEPWWLFPLMFPIHVIGELAKPLSLSIRLFGNIFGEDAVIVIVAGLGLPLFLKYWVPIPVQFPLMAFGLFTGFVQALIFATLAASYIALMVGDEHH